MLKRMLLLLSVMVVFFSVQADPILYTFQGSITSTSGNIDFTLPDQVFYNISIDWDKDAYYGFGSNVYKDYLFENADMTLLNNYGEASYVDGGVFFVDGEIFKAAAYANEYTLDYTDVTLPDMASSGINIEGGDENGKYHRFAFSSDYNALSLGNTFSFLESYQGTYSVFGTATLVAVNGSGSTNVPEPGTLVLLSGGIVGLSGLRLRRKK